MQFVLSIILAASVWACHPGLTPADPKAAQALKADAVVIRVNEFQSALIQWCGPGPECAANTIDTSRFREILTLCIDLRRTLRAVPDGWPATVKAAWVGASPKLDPLRKNPVIAASLLAVDAVLGSI